MAEPKPKFRQTGCDKCGQPVPVANDCITFDCYCEAVEQGRAKPLFGMVGMYEARHLLPTATCEGSPSRAQYLGGQRDPRPNGFAYREEWAENFKKAYEWYQREYSE